jgi:uncharacterized protein YegP (UPF0339 family)
MPKKHWAKYKIEKIKNAKGGKQKYRWRIVSCNGRIVCDSETYKDKRGPEQTIKNLIRAIKEGQFKLNEEWTIENE